MASRSRALFLVAAMFAFGLATPSTAVAQQTCMTRTSWDNYGAEVSIEICYSSSGQPPSIVGVTDWQAVWDSYGCSSSIGRPWEEGDTVSIQVDHEVTGEWLEWLDLNPTARWASFAFWCDPNDGPPIGAPFYNNDENAADRATYASTIFILGDPPVNPRTLRDLAAARIAIPEPDPRSAPDYDVADSTITVQVPTWFWIDHDWATVGPEVETLNNATVVVTAEPINATWELGDGTTIECATGGTEWFSGLDDAASDCQHIYLSSSADSPSEVFGATVTVEWQYSWWLNGTFMEVFGPSEPDTAFDIPVGEIQALSGAES